MNDDTNYTLLREVLDAAYEQAARGKGAERHGNGLPFEDQPMQTISNLLNNDAGMAFQAVKKIVEGRNLETKEARIREYLGAINYIAGMVIRENQLSFNNTLNTLNTSAKKIGKSDYERIVDEHEVQTFDFHPEALSFLVSDQSKAIWRLRDVREKFGVKGDFVYATVRLFIDPYDLLQKFKVLLYRSREKPLQFVSKIGSTPTAEKLEVVMYEIVDC